MKIIIEKSLSHALNDANILCIVKGSLELLTLEEFNNKSILSQQC